LKILNKEQIANEQGNQITPDVNLVIFSTSASK
jgi:hypothetical protein